MLMITVNGAVREGKTLAEFLQVLVNRIRGNLELPPTWTISRQIGRCQLFARRSVQHCAEPEHNAD